MTRTLTTASSNVAPSILYLFNRDLRISDNKCLADAIDAAGPSGKVYPIFIFTPEQVIKNKYYNPRSILFMCGILRDLCDTIPLCIFKGDTTTIISRLIRQHKIAAIYNNMDVSPYARERTANIARICKDLGATFVSGQDIFYGRGLTLTKANGHPYLKFTPFYNNALNKVIKLQPISTNNLNNLYAIGPRQISLIKQIETVAISKQEKIKHSPFSSGQLLFAPTRQSARAALLQFKRSSKIYAKVRDIPSANATTHLSAYLHFGAISAIEVAAELRGTRNHKDIVRQLLWREFYLYIIWMQHTDYSKKSRTILANNKIKWQYSSNKLERWQRGLTGCPIVDAGMRELNTSGYMQNRLRMIVAMYLIFYLRIDWRHGEQYFAQTLIDYDYCNNLGGWLWSSSWEVHSNEYYRVFSMENQMKRYDYDAAYVYKWLPELKEVPARDLYDWSATYHKYPAVVAKYVKPIIENMSEARLSGIAAYRHAHGK